jgi:hypothetical protein
MTDTNTGDLEARLAALEAYLDPATIAALDQLKAAGGRAAAPPVTIGELADVPAPGSPIASAWSQEVTNRIVHRFATTAAMNAWAAANGSIACVLTATPGLEQWFVRSKSTWQQFAGALPFGVYSPQGPTTITEGTNFKLTWSAAAGSTIPLAGDLQSATIPTRGWYRIDYDVIYNIPPNAGIRSAWFEIGDAVRHATTGAPANASGSTALHGGKDLLLNAGNSVAVFAFSSGGGANVPIATFSLNIRMQAGVAT